MLHDIETGSHPEGIFAKAVRLETAEGVIGTEGAGELPAAPAVNRILDQIGKTAQELVDEGTEIVERQGGYGD